MNGFGRRHLAAMLVFLAFAFLWIRPAQGAPPSLSGRILKMDGRTPVPGAEVTLFPEPGGASKKTVSKSDGRYQFTGIEAGYYRLQAKARGFLEEWR